MSCQWAMDMAVYSKKSIGSRTLPCGTPQVTLDSAESCKPKLTVCVRWRTNDSIHNKTVLCRLNAVESRWIRKSWSTVSNAADISRRHKSVTKPLSDALRMSDTTFKTAVSVEWFFLYADCK